MATDVCLKKDSSHCDMYQNLGFINCKFSRVHKNRACLVVVDAPLHYPFLFLVLVYFQLGQLDRLVLLLREAVDQFTVEGQPANVLVDVGVKFASKN